VVAHDPTGGRNNNSGDNHDGHHDMPHDRGRTAGQMEAQSSGQPMFNAPSCVIAVLGSLLAVHLLRNVLTDGQDEWWVLALSFIPARFSNGGEALPGGQLAAFTSFVTHQFVHLDAAHLLVNSAWLLAIGSIVARRIGGLRFISLYLVSGIAGALVFWIANRGLAVPVIGASGAVSGLMGAVVRFMFKAISQQRGPELRENPAAIPRAPLMEVLRDRRALVMIGSMVGMNLLLGLGLGKLIAEGGIAWEAHLGGFAAGLLLFAWFDHPQGATGTSRGDLDVVSS
jgi:membrane associated rhomboid family serine protease